MRNSARVSHAFLGFNRGSAQKPKLVARAKSFNKDGIFGIILGTLIIGTFAVTCSNGVAYDFWQIAARLGDRYAKWTNQVTNKLQFLQNLTPSMR